MARVGISLLLILIFALSTITLPHGVNAASPVHVSVLGTPVTVDSSFQISFYIDLSYCTTCGTAMAYVRSNSSYTHLWEGSAMKVSGGLDYEVSAPGLSTPGSYFAGVTVIGLNSGGLPGVAVLGETSFSVGGSTTNTPALLTSLPPPSQFGCYTASNATSEGKNNPEGYSVKKPQWTKVTCLSKAQVAQIPPPLQGSPTSSGPGIYGLKMKQHNIAGAGVKVQLSQFGDEWDAKWGTGGFSVQLNTNYFTGANGHQDWVQFVYQKFPSRSIEPLCVWEIDITNNDYDSNTVCVGIPNPTVVLGQGFWAEIDGVALPAGNTVMQDGAAALVIEFTSNAIPQGVVVVAPDTYAFTVSAVKPFGCSLCWNSVDGTILGAGGGSEAFFSSGTNEQTFLYAQYYVPGTSQQARFCYGCGNLVGSSDYSLLITTGETNSMNYIISRAAESPLLYCSDYVGGYCSLLTASVQS